MLATVKGTGTSAIAHTIATDQLTGANIVTNATGIVEELMDYYPYGDIRLDEKTGAYSEQRKYIGQEYDADTGLSYLNARYYNGKIGRFMSQDPLFLAIGDTARIKSFTRQEIQQVLADPQNLNSYAYARNNPLTHSDPGGQWSLNVFAGLPNSWQVGIGNAANNAYNNNAVVRYAMDHPYQAGVATSAVSGAMIVGGVAMAGGSISWGILSGGSATTVATGGTVALTQAPKIEQTAEGAVKLLNGPINILASKLSHVLEGHTVGGLKTAGNSIFNSNVNVVDLIRQGTQQVIQKQSFGSNFQRVFDVGRNIGIDRVTSQQTSVMTIITNKAGNLITSFPGRP